MQTQESLEARWQSLDPAPTAGSVKLICVRTGNGVHQTPDAAELSTEVGVVGDRWKDKPNPNPGTQVTLMNVRVAELITGDSIPLHMPGDNFLVDLDLSETALPAGTRLRLGEALLEVSDVPHTGCGKFAERFGADALKWVNGKAQRKRRLRGVNCRVVEPGAVKLGDPVAQTL